MIKRYIEKIIRRYLEESLTFYSKQEYVPEERPYEHIKGRELMVEYVVYGLMLEGKPIGVVHRDINQT